MEECLSGHVEVTGKHSELGFRDHLKFFKVKPGSLLTHPHIARHKVSSINSNAINNKQIINNK